ncbi:MAG: hypothetical protein ABI361_00505 [Nitrososphaera sp.]
MSSAEFPQPEIAYSCDKCGELFDSEVDAQKHNQKTHTGKVENNDSDRGL